MSTGLKRIHFLEGSGEKETSERLINAAGSKMCYRSILARSSSNFVSSGIFK